MTKEKERWGIHVDGIKMPGFNSEEEANKYKENKLKGKDAVVFQYQPRPKTTREEDHYTPGHT